jgi:hypothetical protein
LSMPMKIAKILKFTKIKAQTRKCIPMWKG